MLFFPHRPQLVEIVPERCADASLTFRPTASVALITLS